MFRSWKCLYRIKITGIECGLKSGLERNQVALEQVKWILRPQVRRDLNVNLRITGMGIVGDAIRNRIGHGFGSKSWNTWKDLMVMLILILGTCMVSRWTRQSSVGISVSRIQVHMSRLLYQWIGTTITMSKRSILLPISIQGWRLSSLRQIIEWIHSNCRQKRRRKSCCGWSTCWHHRRTICPGCCYNRWCYHCHRFVYHKWWLVFV